MTFVNCPDLKVVFDYGDADRLKSIHFEGEFSSVQSQWVLSNTPMSVEGLAMEGYFGSSKIKVRKVEDDLSFNNFWNKYNHKHGNKKRAAALWEALTDAEKALALSKITHYLQSLAYSNIEQAHASTWLYQRRFEN